MLVSLRGGDRDALVDHLRCRSASAVPPLAGEPALARDGPALEDIRAHRVAEVARQPRAEQPQVREARSVVAEARRRGEARRLCDSAEEALGAARPGQRVALLLGQRRGRRDERGAQCSAELLRCLIGEDVGEALEEGVLRPPLNDGELTHGERLGRGSGEHLGLAWVDEDLVRVERLVAVVAPTEEAQVHCRLRRGGLDLGRVLAVAV
mmetsp:Transcript_60201/g.144690  ORF Transcript_60201/g.144690 Transcript_60201/m.144690 type:complete len:209 (-) Transcript_60201:216-842(-)